MYSSQCFRRFSLFDDSGNVSLRRSLCDCPYVDAGFPKRTKKLSGHAQPLDHAVAYHGNDAATLGEIDCLNFTALHLDNERLLNCLLRKFRMYVRNGEAD